MTGFYTFPDKPRGIIRISGADRIEFLQGLVSNDVRLVSPAKAIWSALLTPQGRYLHDFFVVEHQDSLLIEMAAERVSDLARRLKLYKLRSKISIEPVEGLETALAWGDEVLAAFGLTQAGDAKTFGDVIVVADPRHRHLGVRLIGPTARLQALLAEKALEHGSYDTWDRLRLELGAPDDERDLVPNESLLLENGFDELHGVAWDKGCYVGQEITARMKYRGLLKKRLVPFNIEGPTPPAGTLLSAGGDEIGEMRSAQANFGLALVKLSALGKPVLYEQTRLVAKIPDWMPLP